MILPQDMSIEYKGLQKSTPDNEGKCDQRKGRGTPAQPPIIDNPP